MTVFNLKLQKVTEITFKRLSKLKMSNTYSLVLPNSHGFLTSTRTRTHTNTQNRAILMAIYLIKLLIPEILVYHTFL